MSNFIEFLPDEVRFEVQKQDSDVSMLEFAQRKKIDISTSCGGNGTCGACRIAILDGIEKLPLPNEVEQEFIQERHFATHERLACQIPVVPGIKIKI